jgi:proteasome lid subunit RPN8/RPN11
MTLESSSSERPEAPPAPPQQPAERVPTASLLHGRRSEDDDVRLGINQAALRQIALHAASDPTKELAGALLGRYRIGEGRYRVEVQAALPLTTEDHGPAHFTFTADAWARLNRDRPERYPDLEVVGWYHTHPDFGIFFSEDDLVVQRSSFYLPWQVALVLDPVRQEEGIFAWKGDPDEEPVVTAMGGYAELLDQQKVSMLNWRYVSGPVGDAGAARTPEAPGWVYAPRSGRPMLPPISPWWGVITGGLGLLIALALLLERLIGQAE